VPIFQKIQETQKVMSQIATNIGYKTFNLDNMARRHLATLDKLEQGSEKLGKAGWIIPMDFSFAKILTLIEGYHAEEIDVFFLKHYTADNNKQLNLILSKMLPDKGLMQWRPLLEDCKLAFQHGCYKVTIPCLLSILEGMMAKFINDPRSIRMTNMIKSCEKFKDVEALRIKRLILTSVINFINNVFATSYFDNERPSLINRHWILHGRDETDWKEIDSIRLFLAIDTMRHVLPEDDPVSSV